MSTSKWWQNHYFGVNYHFKKVNRLNFDFNHYSSKLSSCLSLWQWAVRLLAGKSGCLRSRMIKKAQFWQKCLPKQQQHLLTGPNLNEAIKSPEIRAVYLPAAPKALNTMRFSRREMDREWKERKCCLRPGTFCTQTQTWRCTEVCSLSYLKGCHFKFYINLRLTLT